MNRPPSRDGPMAPSFLARSSLPSCRGSCRSIRHAPSDRLTCICGVWLVDVVADGPNGCGGAHHANEQPFVFHVLSETSGELAEDKGHYHINASNPREVALSNQTVGFWASMAGSGSPGSSWPVYDKATPKAMVFGVPDPTSLPAAAIPNVRTAKCDFWDAQFAKVMAAHPDGRPSRGSDGSDPWL